MSSFRRLARPLAAALLGLSVGLAVAAPVAAAPLTPSEKTEVAKAEQYINDITTLRAHFMQASPSGATAEGTMFLSRPGKMRLEYDPPSPILVIADGAYLIYYDKELQQVSYVDLDSTPAGVLVRPQVKLDGDDQQVTKVVHQTGVLQLTVIKKSDPSQGQITLVFTDSPFQLKQWRVVDQQGQITTVSLFDAQTGVALDKQMFRFKDPKFTGKPDLGTQGK
jgi:outer membrane lipoprotein-sorting protein